MMKINKKVVILICIIFVIIISFMCFKITYKKNSNYLYEENIINNVAANQILSNDDLDYNSKGKVIAKKVVRINELNNKDLLTVTKDTVLIIDKEDFRFITINNIIDFLKKEIIVLLKYENLKNDVLFYETKGIEIREYDISKEEMKKYENDGYINLELKENEKISLDTYLFKAESDENLLKYINMSIKLL